jgi:lipid-A-disaccharide synthase
VGILPGSRLSEIRRHLPVMIEAFKRLRINYPKARGAIFRAQGVADAEYNGYAADGVALVRDDDYAVRRGLDLAICSSGTATLENALLGVPMVVVYKMSWLTYRVARAIVRVPYISMANILAGKRLVPELIQSDANPRSVAKAALELLEDPRRYAQLRRELLAIRQTLGTPGAADRAAGSILKGVGR